MPRCLSEGVDIFLKSAERQGGVNRRFTTGGRCHGWQLEPCPYGLEPLYHFSIENSHLETRHQGMMFRSPRAFVRSTATLRYEPCTQFINVSPRALHIYFIDGCRKYPKNNEFRTKKFLNQEFLYGISSFCMFSENNSLLRGKISCFCIFLAKNGVFNTNRFPRGADGIRNEPHYS